MHRDLVFENKNTNKQQVNALFSLMCFYVSRFDSPLDKNGELVLYEDQDVNLWDADLIRKGEYFLNCCARGNRILKFHLEAAIAYRHTQKENTKEKWENILQLYNQLLQIEYSPIAALNKTYALSKANSKEDAIIEAEKLNLQDNHFYFALLGELYTNIDNKKAKLNSQKAISFAKTQTNKHEIQKKIEKII